MIISYHLSDSQWNTTADNAPRSDIYMVYRVYCFGQEHNVMQIRQQSIHNASEQQMAPQHSSNL